MVPPYSNSLPRGPSYSSTSNTNTISDTGLSPSVVRLPSLFSCTTSIYNVRALPISLAATLRISVDFFSCGYLDVSVPHVRFLNLFIQSRMTLHSMLSSKSTQCRAGFPHSDINGSSLVCQLPVAFRRLLRPSSPLIA